MSVTENSENYSLERLEEEPENVVGAVENFREKIIRKLKDLSSEVENGLKTSHYVDKMNSRELGKSF
jgi:hypothetical protein